MKEKTVSRLDLLRRLQRAAQVKSLLTMLSIVIFLFVAVALFGPQADWMMLLIFFGGTLIVDALLTHLYCKRKVACEHCGRSLWQCGTGNFKPRRMKVREDATECPNCHARLV